MDDAATVLAWMVADGRVCLPAADLAGATAGLGDGPGAGLERLMVDGLVEAWADEGGPCLTLTPLGAARCGLEVDRDGGRWQAAGTGGGRVYCELKEVAGRHAILETDMAGIGDDGDRRRGDLDWIVDRRAPDPAEQAGRIEAIERAAAEAEVAERERAILEVRYGRRHPSCAPPVRERFDLPEVILTGVMPWPLPGPVRGPQAPDWPLRGSEEDYKPGVPCRACRGRELPPAVACAWCDRSGVDHLLEKVPSGRSRGPYRPENVHLAGGIGTPARAAKGKKKAKAAKKGVRA